MGQTRHQIATLRDGRNIYMKRTVSLAIILLTIFAGSVALAEPKVIDLWPGEIPGPLSKADGPEQDRTKPDDRLIAGKRIIKLANVSKPQMHVFLPAADKANGGAVVICPGGGYHILAWDLEGTEVAQWLNELGFAAIVLKYRVPTGHHGDPGKWQGPVMDAQRALSITRSHADDWKLDSQRIGILGFSAGGNAAARTAVSNGNRLYDAIDDADKNSCAANFAILVYPAWLADEEGDLKAELAVDKNTPPMFFAHAADDRVSCLSSVALFTELKKNNVPAELHIYATGGHGYGLRPTKMPVTRWPDRAAAWLSNQGLDVSE